MLSFYMYAESARSLQCCVCTAEKKSMIGFKLKKKGNFMLKKNRPCPRCQLLAFTIRSMGLCRRYSIYLKIFQLFPLFESRKTALTLILRRSRTGTVWFYTSTSNKRAARPKLYTKPLTRVLKRMYSRLTLVRISIKLQAPRFFYIGTGLSLLSRERFLYI